MRKWNEEDVATHLFQIWIIPARVGGVPRWAAAKFPKADRAGQLVVLASGRPVDEGKGALMIRQDAAILGAKLNPGQSVTHALGLNRFAYLVAAKGALTVNGTKIGERSAVGVAGEPVARDQKRGWRRVRPRRRAAPAGINTAPRRIAATLPGS